MLVRRAFGCGVLLVVMSFARAHALPSPQTSSGPSHVRIVGLLGGTADPAGTFEVVVRDLAANPVPNPVVVVDFSQAPNLEFAADQHDPAAMVFCAQRYIRKFGDSGGRVTVTLLGSGGRLLAEGVGLSALRIFANGVLIRSPNATSFDLDGRSGLGANDLQIWLSDFGVPDPFYVLRSDFDGDGSVGAADLSMWLTAFGDGAYAEPIGATCP